MKVAVPNDANLDSMLDYNLQSLMNHKVIAEEGATTLILGRKSIFVALSITTLSKECRILIFCYAECCGALKTTCRHAQRSGYLRKKVATLKITSARHLTLLN